MTIAIASRLTAILRQRVVRIMCVVVMVAVVAHLIATGVGLWFLHRAQTRIAALGLPTTMDEILPKIRDEDNAAVLYDKALVLLTLESGKYYSPGYDEGRLPREYLDITDRYRIADPASWSEAQRREAERSFANDDFQRSCAWFATGSCRPECCFALPWRRDGEWTIMTPFQPTRRAGELLLCQARLLALAGSRDRSWDLLTTVVRMGTHLGQTPVPAMRFLQSVVETEALEAGRMTLAEAAPGARTLADIGDALAGIHPIADMVQVCDYSIALGAEGLFSSDPPRWADEPFTVRHRFKLAIYRSGLLAPLRFMDHAAYIDLVRSCREAMARRDASWRPSAPFYAIRTRADLDDPWYPQLFASLQRQEESIALARVAFALERFRIARGGYPARLDDLAPAFLPQVPMGASGRPLAYRVDGDGWRLDGEESLFPAKRAEDAHWRSPSRAAAR